MSDDPKRLTTEEWEQIIDPNEKYAAYSSLWTSFPRLKAHLLKNNTSIEWLNRPVADGKTTS